MINITIASSLVSPFLVFLPNYFPSSPLILDVTKQLHKDALLPTNKEICLSKKCPKHLAQVLHKSEPKERREKIHTTQ